MCRNDLLNDGLAMIYGVISFSSRINSQLVGSCAGKILFVLVLVIDCHDHSGTWTVVPLVAAYFGIDLPAITFVHSCNS